MKSLIQFFMLCLIVTQFIACQKEANKPITSIPVTADAIAGNFTVGLFTGTNDQTATFNGYTFTFKENGTIVATNGSDTFNGTWRFDDSNSSEIKINFSNAPLNQLNGSWHIAELTDDHLHLTHDSDDDHGNDDHDHDDDHSSHHSSLEFERD